MFSPEPLALPLVAIMARSSDQIDAVLPRLQARFGEIHAASPTVDFGQFTDYYVPEFGSPLVKRLVFFQPLREQAALAGDKLWTCDLERELAGGQARTLNLDPGYLTLSKLVLASTKDHAHRIYLGQGIHAEITLFFRDKSFQTHPWSYPDYAAWIPFINGVRAGLRPAFPGTDPARFR